MDGDAAPKRRPGRPRVRDEPGFPAQYVGFRASHKLKEQLEKSAAASGRSLSTEAQFRLEESYRDEGDLFSPEVRHQGRRLIGIYIANGAAGVVRLMTGLPDLETGKAPGEAEQRRRWQEMRDTLETARWASPEAEDRYQRLQRKVEELNARFEAAAKKDQAA